MNKNLKTAFKIISFFILFLLIFSYFSKVFSQKWGYEVLAAKSFYKQPKDSIDVIFLGASGLHWGLSPLTIWEEVGITSFIRATPGQQTPMMYYYLLESLEYQKPKVVVLDAYRLVRYYSFDEVEVPYRRSYEPMKLSLVKIRAFFDVTKESNLDTSISLLVPFYRYHTRWDDLNWWDFEIFPTEEDPYRGQAIGFENLPIEIPEDFMNETNGIVRIEEVSRYYFEKIIELCKKNEIEVFLLSMPRLSKADYGEYEAVKDFAKEHQLLFIDYNLANLMAEVGFDPANDMVDDGHPNSCGAIKFSRHLSRVLAENFDLPDRRHESIAEQWNADAVNLQSQVSEFCRDLSLGSLDQD